MIGADLAELFPSNFQKGTLPLPSMLKTHAASCLPTEKELPTNEPGGSRPSTGRRKFRTHDEESFLNKYEFSESHTVKFWGKHQFLAKAGL